MPDPNDRYRAAAACWLRRLLGHEPYGLKATVREHAYVHPVRDGGAFVEVTLWVPDGALGALEAERAG